MVDDMRRDYAERLPELYEFHVQMASDYYKRRLTVISAAESSYTRFKTEYQEIRARLQAYEARHGRLEDDSRP
jgi:hypothetical protein